MKHFAILAAVYLFLHSTSQAVVWISVTITAYVQQGPGPGGTLTKTTLTTRKYLEEAVRDFRVPGTNQPDPNLKNYFVGFRTDNGQVAVVHFPSESVAYQINSAVAGGGSAANGTNTIGSVAGNSTVSSLDTDATGFVFDKFSRFSDGSIKSVARQFIGGSPGLTIIGTVRTGAKRFTIN